MGISYKNKGMTLIEVIVALAIFGIISISFLNLFSKGYTDIFKSGFRTSTTMKLQSMVDYLNSQTINSIDEIDTYITNYLSSKYSYTKDVNYKKVIDVNSLSAVESNISVKYYISSLGAISSTTPNIQGYQVTILWFINNSQSNVQITTFIIKGGA
ncbi:MAG: prepilin-type N-terminal cleavage/methylation domain-containing protein [Clostridiaceae bacterium]|nr:prepilin-type N-terminal cleavage/methylation domain-containing protein [Clostridiaceae bacterium]